MRWQPLVIINFQSLPLGGGLNKRPFSIYFHCSKDSVSCLFKCDIMRIIFVMCLHMLSVDDWLASFDVRISPFVNLKVTLEEDEIVKLGKKSEDEYPFAINCIILAIFICYCCHYRCVHILFL